MNIAVKITLYINEADQYDRRALYLAIIDFLEENQISGVTLLRGIAGFTHPASLGTTMPLILECIDTPMNIDKVLPTLKKMVGQRLITREPVEVVNYHI